MSKIERYAALVQQLKQCKFPEGLVNPFEIDGENTFREQNHINPWSVWQHDLDAQIMVIGQDWGSVKYFQENKGRDDDGNPTNATLQKLLAGIGFDPGVFSRPNAQPLFFANAVLGIRAGDYMSGPVRMEWVTHSKPFIEKLLAIVQPNIVITLGAIPLSTIRMIAGEEFIPAGKMRDIAPMNPHVFGDNQKLFAMYHCGPLGLANLARDSKMEGKKAMENSWDKIKRHV
jgi:DNA polymerase